MSNEFRVDPQNASGAGLNGANNNAVLVALPSNSYWHPGTSTWLTLPNIATADEAALGVAVTQEAFTGGTAFSGAVLASMPNVAPPSGTITVRAFFNPTANSTFSNNVLQYTATSDYWVNLPTSGGGGGTVDITIKSSSTVINP